MLEIDGSQGEGGGQVLRTALALAALQGKPVRIFNVRAGRRKPGLAPQHLAGVLAAAQICNAEVGGAAIRSIDITFVPGGPAKPGSYTFDVSTLSGQGSAGAVTLLLQSILLPLALAEGPSHLVLRGGTHVAWSPPVHYVDWVLLPTLAQMGLNASIRLNCWGWYPEGGGEVEVDIAGGARLRGLDLTARGDLVQVRGIAAVSNLPSHIPQRIAGHAANLLHQAGLPPNVQPTHGKGRSTGAGLFIALHYQRTRAGFTALGKPGRPSEVVAEEAAEAAIAFHRRSEALGRYLPDQILPIMALAEGPSALETVDITRHTLTNAEIVRLFVGREIVVEGEEGQPGVVHVEGSGPA